MNTQNITKTEARLRADMNRAGEILLDAGGTYLPDYPEVARVTVEFDGYRGGGDIIAIDMFPPGEDTRPLHPDIAGELLEETVPGPEGEEGATIGGLIDALVLGLLELRHPGWADDEGSCGEVELAWTTDADGNTATTIGGTYQQRFIATRENPLWDDGADIHAGKEVAHAGC